MKILFAPDSYKGSLSAKEFCKLAKEVCTEIKLPFKLLPLADGGEGTTDALVEALKGEYAFTEVTAPNGNKVIAKYGLLPNNIAVMEMAQASGLSLASEKRDIFSANTYGTGEMIISAMDKGAKTIIIGIGGSATNDGGAGALAALGVTFKNKEGKTILFTPRELLNIYSMDFEGLDNRLKDTKILVAGDVKNPLCGVNGAANVYGRQKGAKDGDIAVLDKILKNFATAALRSTGKDIINKEGAGAAGGLGAGLMLLPKADFKAGFNIISDMLNLPDILKDGGYDLIVTGEGQLNFQSVMGKLPVEIAKLGKLYGIPCVAIVGSLGENWQLAQGYFKNIYAVMEEGMSLEYAINNANKLVKDKLREVIHDQVY